MAFLGKLGNVLEDAASFAVPAGLFALGTFAGGGNPLAGKALMGAAASGAGGFARNEEEERIRKAQEEARRSSAVANLMNAISPGTGARGAAPVMPKAGLMETVARGGAQGYDFYKKAEMAANAAKEMKNRLAQQAFEKAQRTGEMAAVANFGKGQELVDAPTPLTDTLNKQRGGGGAKGVTQLGEFGPRGQVNPFASNPTQKPVESALPGGAAAGMPASFESITGGGMRPEAAVGAQAMEAPPSAVDPFLQRPLSLTNIPTDTSLAGGQPSSIGLQTTPYERRVLQDVENPFDRETQPTEYGSYEQETRRLQANADVAARAQTQIEMQRDRLEYDKMAAIAAGKQAELEAKTAGLANDAEFTRFHYTEINKIPSIEKYSDNQANLVASLNTINGMLERGESITGNVQMMWLRVLQRAIDDAQVTEKDLAITQELQPIWDRMKLKIKRWTPATAGEEQFTEILDNKEIVAMVGFLEQANIAVEEQAMQSIGNYTNGLRELGEEKLGYSPGVIDRLEKGAYVRYRGYVEQKPPTYTGEYEGGSDAVGLSEGDLDSAIQKKLTETLSTGGQLTVPTRAIGRLGEQGPASATSLGVSQIGVLPKEVRLFDKLHENKNSRSGFQLWPSAWDE